MKLKTSEMNECLELFRGAWQAGSVHRLQAVIVPAREIRFTLHEIRCFPPPHLT